MNPRYSERKDTSAKVTLSAGTRVGEGQVLDYGSRVPAADGHATGARTRRAAGDLPQRTASHADQSRDRALGVWQDGRRRVHPDVRG